MFLRSGLLNLPLELHSCAMMCSWWVWGRGVGTPFQEVADVWPWEKRPGLGEAAVAALWFCHDGHGIGVVDPHPQDTSTKECLIGNVSCLHDEAASCGGMGCKAITRSCLVFLEAGGQGSEQTSECE